MEMIYFILTSVLLIAVGAVVWAVIAHTFMTIHTALKTWILFWRMWPVSCAAGFGAYTALHLSNYAREPETWLLIILAFVLGYTSVPWFALLVHITMMKMYSSQQTLDDSYSIKLLMHHLRVAAVFHRALCRLRHLELADVLGQVVRSEDMTCAR